MTVFIYNPWCTKSYLRHSLLILTIFMWRNNLLLTRVEKTKKHMCWLHKSSLVYILNPLKICTSEIPSYGTTWCVMQWCLTRAKNIPDKFLLNLFFFLAGWRHFALLYLSGFRIDKSSICTYQHHICSLPIQTKSKRHIFIMSSETLVQLYAHVSFILHQNTKFPLTHFMVVSGMG